MNHRTCTIDGRECFITDSVQPQYILIQTLGDHERGIFDRTAELIEVTYSHGGVLPLWLPFNPAWKNRTSSIWVPSCRKFSSIACTCRPMSRQNSWLIRRMTSFMLKDLENGRRLYNPSIRTTLICWSYKSYLTSPPQSIHGRKL